MRERTKQRNDEREGNRLADLTDLPNDSHLSWGGFMFASPQATGGMQNWCCKQA